MTHARKTRPARRASLSLADLEQSASHALGPETAVIKVDRPCRVHIHTQRHRLADPDGLCGKYLLDAFVSAGVLPDDRAEYISQVSFSQEKIPTSQPEKTIIEFYVED